MKILKEVKNDGFDLVISGLGFESRCLETYKKYNKATKEFLYLGYKNENNNNLYLDNRKKIEYNNLKALDLNDKEFQDQISNLDLRNIHSIGIDISVMSRHRLSFAIYTVLQKLTPGSTLTIMYTLSEYCCPPEEITPVKKVGPICEKIIGSLGDLGKPTTAIIGLGYEKSKAIGINNYIEPNETLLFFPKSQENKFETDVSNNNADLIESVEDDQIYEYNVHNPVSTYLELRSLVYSTSKFNRCLLVPLGPKILSALCVILSFELKGKLPVWRVSSEQTETPIDRKSSGHIIEVSIQK